MLDQFPDSEIAWFDFGGGNTLHKVEEGKYVAALVCVRGGRFYWNLVDILTNDPDGLLDRQGTSIEFNEEPLIAAFRKDLEAKGVMPASKGE